MTDIAVIKAKLSAQLAELEARAGRIETDLSEPLSADSAEQATELEDDQVLEGQEALLAREIAMVEAALKRVADGSYGECTRCGGPVGGKRLEAYPEAALCISCAREVENR
jgi:DnaK suppressor protein